MRMTKQNLHNIKSRFEEKTGTQLRPKRYPVQRIVVLAAAIICCLAMVAFTYPLFTPLDGDELTLSATYEGSGIISIYVENGSDKTLEFEEQVKLISWSTSEEVAQTGGEVLFDNTVFEAHSAGTMTVDLSKAYDIEALETPIPGRPEEVYYYLLLTNNSFLFGHDWMCSFHFVEDVPGRAAEEGQLEKSLLSAQNLEDVEEELRFYFEDAYYDEIPAFNQANFTYLQKVQEVLMRTKGTLVHPVDPWMTVQREGAIFDEKFPSDIQHQLVGLNYHSIDGYNRIVGSMFSGEDSDYALTLKAMLPGYEGQTNGGHYLPLLYLFIYEQASLEADNPYAFVYGQVLSFEELEQYKVYEDERYVVYEVTDLFYTDLDAYIEYFLSVTKDVYYDDQIRRRAHNIYDYYRENIGDLLVNRQAEAEARGYQP